MRAASVSLLMVSNLLTPAMAAVQDYRTCVENFPADDKQLADCVRDVNDKELAEAAKEKPEPPLPTWTVKVRNSITNTVDFTQFDAGAKGASWSLVRDQGEQVQNASVGVFAYRLPAKDDLKGRFQLFGGAAITKSGTGTGKKDIRDLTIGVTGNAFQTPESGPMTGAYAFKLQHTEQYIYREDRFGASQGHLVRLHGDALWAPLANGDWIWFGVVPQLGLVWERRTGGGNWSAAYAGFVAGKKIGRIQGSFVGRRLHDFRAPPGNAKRRDNFASLSVDYFLYDTANESAAFQPSLYITRQIGNDFLTGISKANKTEAGIRVKFN